MGPTPLPKKGMEPQFSSHVYCGQMAGWIKMPLGTEVRLDPDDIALDGDPSPHPHKGGRAPSPTFGPRLLWPNGWMHKMTLGMEECLGPGNIVLDGDTAPLLKKGNRDPQFSAHFIVAKRLHASRCHLG